FLIAVVIGEGNRHLRLPGTAGYMSRMRFIGNRSGDSGNGTRERQSRRRRRKLLRLTPGGLVLADAAVDYVLNQFQQMAVLNLLDAVRKNHEFAIDLVQFAAFKLVSQLFTAQ